MHAPILMDMATTCVSIISFPPAVQEIFNGKFITTFSVLCKPSLNDIMGVLKNTLLNYIFSKELGIQILEMVTAVDVCNGANALVSSVMELIF